MAWHQLGTRSRTKYLGSISFSAQKGHKRQPQTILVIFGHKPNLLCIITKWYSLISNAFNTLTPCWNPRWLATTCAPAICSHNMGSQNYVAIWSQITQIRYKSVPFTQDELIHWTLDTHKINSVTPNAILLQNDSFKRALSITSKLTNNRNITRYSLTALCFLNGGQHIGNVGVTRGDTGDKAGDILKPIRIYWDTFLLTLYRLQNTHRNGTKHLLEQTSSSLLQQNEYKTAASTHKELSRAHSKPHGRDQKYHGNVK